MSTGEEKAWEDLNNLNPSDVCRKARVFYDRENSYILKSLGMDFSVHPGKREIKNIQPEGEIILKNTVTFSTCPLYATSSMQKTFHSQENLSNLQDLKAERFFSGAAMCFRWRRSLKGMAMIRQALLKRQKPQWEYHELRRCIC